MYPRLYLIFSMNLSPPPIAASATSSLTVPLSQQWSLPAKNMVQMSFTTYLMWRGHGCIPYIRIDWRNWVDGMASPEQWVFYYLMLQAQLEVLWVPYKNYLIFLHQNCRLESPNTKFTHLILPGDLNWNERWIHIPNPVSCNESRSDIVNFVYQ